MFQRFLPSNAPNRLHFKDPDSERVFEGPTWENLILKIVSYRDQNRLPTIAHLRLVIENFLCQQPENVGLCETYKLHRGWFPIWKGALQILKNIAYGEKAMTDQVTAEKRAAICATCPENIFPDKGGYIEWSDQFALAATGGRKTSKDSELSNCAICSCTLKALVHAKGPFEMSDEEITKYPEHCWKAKERK